MPKTGERLFVKLYKDINNKKIRPYISEHEKNPSKTEKLARMGKYVCQQFKSSCHHSGAWE